MVKFCLEASIRIGHSSKVTSMCMRARSVVGKRRVSCHQKSRSTSWGSEWGGKRRGKKAVLKSGKNFRFYLHNNALACRNGRTMSMLPIEGPAKSISSPAGVLRYCWDSCCEGGNTYDDEDDIDNDPLIIDQSDLSTSPNTLRLSTPWPYLLPPVPYSTTFNASKPKLFHYKIFN